MFKLRPKYSKLADAVFVALIGVFLICIPDAERLFGFSLFWPGVMFIALGVILGVFQFIYIQKHTLKFNTKEIKIKDTVYPLSEVQEIRQLAGHNQVGRSFRELTGHLPTVFEIRVADKGVYTFNKKYKHFWEFKAVIEDKGFKLEYF